MIGTKLAHYEITSHLGTGGMGEVFQATDSKLDRSVAIKLLPAAFASDPDRLSRFRREAQLLASLNHPNIAHIYGLEESGDTRCIVMELVQGETLQARIKNGPIPVDEALTIARQIVEALEAAHEKGVVHRDLKPGNVMLTADGRVKVLDFGLAKAHATNPSNATSSNSPTMASMAATNAGMILGTAAYMAPEQARGKPVDKRADIWAFGAVLFEMLTGHRAFPGEDLTDTLANVLKMDPDWGQLPADVPSRARKVMQACLQKNAKQRIGDVQDVRLAMEGAFETLAPRATATVASSSLRGWLPWMAFGVAVLGMIVLAIPATRHLHETRQSETRLDIVTPATDDPTSFALSPDGRQIVFVASSDGASRLWLRSLAAATAQPLPGTEGARFPFWSPDGHSIGFGASGKVLRVDIGGGSPQTLADAAAFRGGTWGRDGTILFAPAAGGSLSRIPSSGGEPVRVTNVDPPRFINHRFPQFLPDGRHFLFFAFGSSDRRGIYFGSLDGGEPKRLTDADTSGLYMAPNTLLFVRQGVLTARRLDTAQGILTGDPVTVADSVIYDTPFALGGFSVSASGQVAYRTSATDRRRLVWLDRNGKTLGVAGEQDANDMLAPEISPDGRFVAVVRTVQSNTDIFLLDLLRGGTARLTDDSNIDVSPIWSPDAKRIVHASGRTGRFSIFVKSLGGGSDEQLFEGPNSVAPLDWSKDGNFLLYFDINPTTGYDLWALPMTGERKPVLVANTPFEERDAQFSPDGHWVAYQSNESGKFEVYVQPFPGPGGKLPISIAGGEQPRWRADGKELYFLAPDGKLMATTVQISGSKLDAGSPVSLFQTRTPVSGSAVFKAQYAVSRDGRFLVDMPLGESNASPITLIQNWQPPTE